jgi:hypothetical protein
MNFVSPPGFDTVHAEFVEAKYSCEEINLCRRHPRA